MTALMDYPIAAVSEAGQELIAQAEALAIQLAESAGENDREGDFPFASLEALRTTRFLYAPIPEPYGGLGIESVHDVLVAASRLAQGDPALMLGVNMHLVVMLSLARQWQMARNRGDHRRVTTLETTMERLVGEGAFVVAAVSEPNQELTRPQTRATSGPDGWVLDGKKIFTSGAPAATHFSVSVSRADEDGADRYAFVLVPRDTPGMVLHADWDGLGMRASGSWSVSFDRARIAAGPGHGMTAGRLTVEYLDQFLVSGAAHAATSLGMTEAAAALGARAASRHCQPSRAGHGLRPAHYQWAAENAVDLAAARAVFSRALLRIEQYYATHPTDRAAEAEAHAVFSEVQKAKAFVSQAATRVVDRAMSMVGGAAYLSGHPLARLYRDARATAFMHPLGDSLAADYLGAVALGICPSTL
jgi:alkylation response protein AidB-like acyl-CoA dehydrogenase